MKLDDFYIRSYVFQRDKNIGKIEKSKKFHTRGLWAQKLPKSNVFRRMSPFGHFLDPSTPWMMLYRIFEFTIVLIALKYIWSDVKIFQFHKLIFDLLFIFSNLWGVGAPPENYFKRFKLNQCIYRIELQTY